LNPNFTQERGMVLAGEKKRRKYKRRKRGHANTNHHGRKRRKQRGGAATAKGLFGPLKKGALKRGSNPKKQTW